MTALTDLRDNYLNPVLGRAVSDTLPWSDTEASALVVAALRRTWMARPRIGLMVTGDVSTSSTVNEYTVPNAIGTVDGKFVISRIDIIQNSLYVDRVVNWREVPSAGVVIKPLLASGYTLRFTGWKPFAEDASDLPARLSDAICHLAAAIGFGNMSGKLVNYQRQQAIDSARVVTYQEAVAMSAYWLRMYQDEVADDMNRVTSGPRAAHR